MSSVNCQWGFEGYEPLKLTAIKSGNNVLVYAENQSTSIIQIKRIILRGEWTNWTLWLYLRKPDFVISDQIEQGTTFLMYVAAWPPGLVRAQAEAEYIEFAGRAISKCW